jgi:hypothetical protein
MERSDQSLMRWSFQVTAERIALATILGKTAFRSRD